MNYYKNIFKEYKELISTSKNLTVYYNKLIIKKLSKATN